MHDNEFRNTATGRARLKGKLPMRSARLIILACGVVCLAVASLRSAPAEEPLPVGSHPAAIGVPHFPDRLHAFVWRNWQLVDPERLAEVVGTSPQNMTAIATSMGLPPAGTIPPLMRQRGYITLIRRNWHLLPYDQLLTLLGMSREELAYSLREDDFLFHKLGQLKPKCEPLRYGEPDSEARKRAAEIQQLVEQRFGGQLAQPAEPRFQFVEDLSRTDGGKVSRTTPESRTKPKLRLIYSYFGIYGDPLSDPASDPYPDGLLAKLADVGVNGVWLHVVLRRLAPGGEHFFEFGDGHQQRLQNLRQLAQRCRRHGIGVYLYINEPRAMPLEFFKERPGMMGVREGEFAAMCTSDPRVRQWLGDSLAFVFREVPELGGVFTITASENLTNCASHFHQQDCPRCGKRTEAEIIAEVNATIAEGVHRDNPQARVIAWDWGWNKHGEAPDTIARLPGTVELMSVSEWAKPIERGGVRSQVGEYSISAVGPGPRAVREWASAQQRGLKTVAKVQLNNTWELSAVPYLPVLDLVAEHCENLAAADVDGMMLSWTLGGYPSPNLEVAHRFATQSDASRTNVLDAIAVARYGDSAAPHVRAAWTAFSNAFREFPYSGSVLYNGPQQMGPANLLYGEPTGYRSTMVGIPYDDVDGWRGPYSPAVLAEQFEKVAAGWAEGLEHFDKAVEASTGENRELARADSRIAQAAYLHFASVANQTRFVIARDELHQPDLSPQRRRALQMHIGRLLDEESSLARRLFAITQQDSRIGFEASNHYFYVPLDLVEKVINCEFLSRELAQQP